jgi:hypothetical protein
MYLNAYFDSLSQAYSPVHACVVPLQACWLVEGQEFQRGRYYRQLVERDEERDSLYL